MLLFSCDKIDKIPDGKTQDQTDQTSDESGDQQNPGDNEGNPGDDEGNAGEEGTEENPSASLGLLDVISIDVLIEEGEYKEFLLRSFPEGATLNFGFDYQDNTVSKLTMYSTYDGKKQGEFIKYDYSNGGLTISSGYINGEEESAVSVYETAELNNKGMVSSFLRSGTTGTVNYDSAGHLLSFSHEGPSGIWYSWYDLEYAWSGDELESYVCGNSQRVRFTPTNYLNPAHGADINACIRMSFCRIMPLNNWPVEVPELTMPRLLGQAPKHIHEMVIEPFCDDTDLNPGIYTEVYVNNEWKTLAQLDDLGIGTYRVRRPASQPIVRGITFPGWEWVDNGSGTLTKAIQKTVFDFYSHEATLIVSQATEDLNGDGVINSEDRYFNVTDSKSTFLGKANLNFEYSFTYR